MFLVDVGSWDIPIKEVEKMDMEGYQMMSEKDMAFNRLSGIKVIGSVVLQGRQGHESSCHSRKRSVQSGGSQWK